ncbi:MAG TPA: VIT domain-containing protein [Hyphomonadaceae bacterium]|nr:VIT domain-containing protein [Hyphomonadaceae bacterium]
MRSKHALRYAVAATVLCLVLPVSAIAQPSAPPDRAGPSMVAYANGIHSDQTKREVNVAALDIAVRIRGEIAETTVTATFTNPGRELLEGQFALNMPRGAVVTGYGLDINGVLIDGVLETKYKAAEAYQRRVSQRIDPGLAEVSYADRFETRIYPINPGSGRTIKLKMVSLLDADGYVLPLNMPGKVGKVSIRVQGDFTSFAMPGKLSAAGGKFEGENVELNGVLKVGAVKRSDVMLVSEHPGAEKFFDILAPAPRPRETRDLPLHVFWDRSVSRTDDKLKAEAQLAQQLAEDRGLTRVRLTLFDSGVVETKDVYVNQLASELGRVRYRGGTSFATLKTVNVAAGSDCLVFTDGRVTIDDRKGFSLPCRTFAVSSGPETDRPWLSDLADRSGGVAVDLGGMKPDEARKALEKPRAGLVSVTDQAGDAIEAVRLDGDASMIHLIGPMPDKGPVLVKLAGDTSPRKFDAPAGSAPIFAGPGALWARNRLGVIASDTAPEDLASMARRYNVATPQASFVVLETPNDYVQANIEPPSTYPKALRQQYAALKAEADEEKVADRKQRFEAVLAAWQEEKDWWKKEFKGKSTKQIKDDADGGDRERRATSAPALALPAPAPAPVLTPSPTAAAPPPPDADKIVVTGSRADSAPTVTDFARAVTADGVPADAAEGRIEPGRAGSTEINEWSLTRPYIKRLDAAGKDWEAALDKEMKANGSIPLFWFDVAEWHWRAGRKEEARRAAEAALDLPTRDNQTLAIVAARLLRYGAYDRAIWLFEQLAGLEPDRPQPSRTLAMALIERAKGETAEKARADLKRAVDLLAKAATEKFDVDASGVETVTLMEANMALDKLKALGGSSDALDKRLLGLLDADVRVVMEWNTPRTDLDLWVTEPKGEKVGYSSPASSWGGKLSGDVTNGYGPEEYLIHRAQAGIYEIRANTFASDRSNPNGPSTLTVRVYRNFGRPNQTEELLDMEMDAENHDMRLIGKVTIK